MRHSGMATAARSSRSASEVPYCTAWSLARSPSLPHVCVYVGRNRQKVEEARDKIAKVYPAAKDWPVFTGDSNKQDEMDQVVSNARVVATTVGPYMKCVCPNAGVRAG